MILRYFLACSLALAPSMALSDYKSDPEYQRLKAEVVQAVAESNSIGDVWSEKCRAIRANWNWQADFQVCKAQLPAKRSDQAFLARCRALLKASADYDVCQNSKHAAFKSSIHKIEAANRRANDRARQVQNEEQSKTVAQPQVAKKPKEPKAGPDLSCVAVDGNASPCVQQSKEKGPEFACREAGKAERFVFSNSCDHDLEVRYFVEGRSPGSLTVHPGRSDGATSCPEHPITGYQVYAQKGREVCKAR